MFRQEKSIMLVEIRCEKFRTETISFHKGLNVVLGDENATNSIGKSSLLMVIDFVYGGNSLLARKDIVEELGHHDYFVSFEFDEEIYRFRRGTYQPDIVYKCGAEYEPITTITVEEYTAFLKVAYGIEIEDITFRSLVGLYFRVWGKDNLNVHKPLHIVQTKSAKECINNLIKTFDRYSAIKEFAEKLKKKEEKSKSLRSAFKNRIIPKISKSEYKQNAVRIERIESEIEDIKANLSRYATNISEVVNREVLELKIQKDELLATKLNVQSKLSRIKRNINENRYIKSKHFGGLIHYFPEINKERLANVEEFHSSVARILRAELRQTERELEEQLSMIDRELSKLDSKMASTLSSIDEPNQIVDRVYDLSTSLHNAKEENDYFENDVALKKEIKQIKENLSNEKLQVLSLLQKMINDSIRRIVTAVFGPDRKSPVIKLKETNYSYEVIKDTGTGTAYASLVVLDLAIFKNTILPFVAHDSLLFKNIENDSVANLFKIYSGIEKQSFVAIDEIEKYGNEASSLLHSRSVVYLDDNNVLYIKDWRK